ncbi:MAG: hypothetical protein SNF33_05555 [Candidatus Algichlamydia australiensis]|nr:hypothetical protein [Chlamydiales bacterium]
MLKIGLFEKLIQEIFPLKPIGFIFIKYGLFGTVASIIIFVKIIAIYLDTSSKQTQKGIEQNSYFQSISVILVILIFIPLTYIIQEAITQLHTAQLAQAFWLSAQILAGVSLYKTLRYKNAQKGIFWHTTIIISAWSCWLFLLTKVGSLIGRA